ncbi:MAG: hypothetical protein EA365_14935 [Gloeocapsa sp. DLM2.Bin57]|nr:MAG: hypothetical protein EA365_14935 [Gloeocapsa sp. DLM2.Bin57]
MQYYSRLSQLMTGIATISLGLLTFSPVRASDLLLVGGAWEYPATGDPYGTSMYDVVVQKGGGERNAIIRIFTTASGSGESAQRNGGFWVDDFLDLYDQRYPGVTPNVEWVEFHIDNCAGLKNQSSSTVINQISESTAIVFGGGDQSLITECFFNEDAVTQTRTTTPVYDALVDKFTNDNIIIAGTSAGTAVQSGIPMITEGESYQALLESPIALVGTPPISRELYYNPLGGLGLFPYATLDTHFSERGRQGRIIRLAAATNMGLAIGIDENTGLLVTDVGGVNESAKVLGENGVNIFNLSNAVVNSEGGYFGIEEVSFSYLTEGDFYNFRSNIASFPSKTVLACDPSQTVSPSQDIFSYRSTPGEGGNRDNPREFVNVALALTESCDVTTQGRSFETNPVAFEVFMTKEANFQGYSGVDSQGETRISLNNLAISIQSDQETTSVPESNPAISLLGLGLLGMVVKTVKKIAKY